MCVCVFHGILATKSKNFFLSLQTFALTHKGSIPIQRDPSLCKKSDSAVVDVGKYVLAKIAQSDLLPHFYPPCLAFFCWNWHFFTPLEDSRADMKKIYISHFSTTNTTSRSRPTHVAYQRAFRNGSCQLINKFEFL